MLSGLENLFIFFVGAAAFGVPVMSFFWWVSERRQNANHADVCWAFLIGVFSLFFGFFELLESGGFWRSILVASLISIWSLRLGGFLLWNRVLKESKEDGRYAKLRKKWAGTASFKFWIVFQAQWLMAFLFAVAIYPSFRNENPFPTWYDCVAVAVFLVSVFGELVADAQLSRFKSDPNNRGKTCRVGLWQYSRHPNYFFEWLHWFTYVFFALGSSIPLVGLSLIGPAMMMFTLWKITGIPVTEEQAKKSRPDYEDYQRTTNMFFPWFPKKENEK